MFLWLNDYDWVEINKSLKHYVLLNAKNTIRILKTNMIMLMNNVIFIKWSNFYVLFRFTGAEIWCHQHQHPDKIPVPLCFLLIIHIFYHEYHRACLYWNHFPRLFTSDNKQWFGEEDVMNVAQQLRGALCKRVEIRIVPGAQSSTVHRLRSPRRIKTTASQSRAHGTHTLLKIREAAWDTMKNSAEVSTSWDIMAHMQKKTAFIDRGVLIK